MDDVTAGFIVATVTGVLVILLFVFLNYRKRRQFAVLKQAGLERGWQVERVQERRETGYRLRGSDSQGDWVLETLAVTNERSTEAGSSDVSHFTRWWSGAVTLDDRGVVIGSFTVPGSPQVFQEFGNSLVQAALRAVFGKKADWISQLLPVEIGSAAFRSRFLCMAHDSHDGERILSPEVEHWLLKIPPARKPVIKLSEDGLEINLQTRQVTDVSELEMIINLGDALGRAWQRGM